MLDIFEVVNIAYKILKKKDELQTQQQLFLLSINSCLIPMVVAPERWWVAVMVLVLRLVVAAPVVAPVVTVRVVHPSGRPKCHHQVLDEPWARVHAGGLALGTGKVFEAHGELAIALAQLVRTGVATGQVGLPRN